MAAFYSDQYEGQTGLATGWTGTTTPTFSVSLSTQLGSDAHGCAAGASNKSAYLPAVQLGTKEGARCYWMIDRRTGGLYDHQIDLCLGAAGARTQGITVRIRRTANATNSVEIVANVLGGSAGSAVGSLADAFEWTWLVELTYSGGDALVRVYPFQENRTFGAAVYERTILAADLTGNSGFVGMFATGTSSAGQAFVNMMRIAGDSEPYAFCTTPALDNTPFAAHPSGTHRLRVKGVCGNSPGSIEGRFVPDVGDPTEWQTIDAAPGSTFDGYIETTTAGTGDVEVRPSADPSNVDRLRSCTIGLVCVRAGQSNSAGRAAALGTFTPSGGIAHALIWPSNVSASTITGNQYWRTSSAGESDFLWMTLSSTGSPVPQIASLVSSRLGLHYIMLGHALGDTQLVGGTWAAGGTDTEKLEYNLARSGLSGINFVEWWQGEGDAANAASEQDYMDGLLALRERIAAIVGDDFKMLLCPLGQQDTATLNTDALARQRIDPIRAAMAAVIKAYPTKFAWGANVYAYDLRQGASTPDGLHFKNADAVTYAADAVADAIQEAWTGIPCRGPIPVSCRWIKRGVSIEVTYDRPVAKGGAASWDGSKVLDGGSEAAHTVAFTNGRVRITLTTPSSDASSVRVFIPTGNQAADGSVTSGSFVASAADTALPALPLIEYPLPPAGAFPILRRRRS